MGLNIILHEFVFGELPQKGEEKRTYYERKSRSNFGNKNGYKPSLLYFHFKGPYIIPPSSTQHSHRNRNIVFFCSGGGGSVNIFLLLTNKSLSLSEIKKENSYQEDKQGLLSVVLRTSSLILFIGSKKRRGFYDDETPKAWKMLTRLGKVPEARLSLLLRSGEDFLGSFLPPLVLLFLSLRPLKRSLEDGLFLPGSKDLLSRRSAG